MLALREFQRAFAAAITTGDMAAVAAFIAPSDAAGGLIEPADRLRIHRNTMLASLATALALTYPAVEALVGTAFFEQAARSFVQIRPPRAPLLSLYGAAFAEFLESYPLVSNLPYLADVARLEWAVDKAAHGPTAREARPSADIALGNLRLALAPSLVLLETEFPAEPIWRAVLDGDEAALSTIDPSPRHSRLAIWREYDGAAVASLGPIAYAFLECLLDGGDAAAAMSAAALADIDSDPIAAITDEILHAPFARLFPIDKPQGDNHERL